MNPEIANHVWKVYQQVAATLTLAYEMRVSGVKQSKTIYSVGPS